MEKAILDTCFLNKLSDTTKVKDDFYILIKAADLDLQVNEYIYKNEMDVTSRAEELVKQGVCSVVEFDEYIKKDEAQYYKDLFIAIYNEFYVKLNKIRPEKANTMRLLKESDDIFNLRMGGSSIGDVHNVLMALYMEIPIILTEDSDTYMIYKMAQKNMSSQIFQLKVYTVKSLIEELDGRDDITISHKVLKRMARAYRNRRL